MAAHPIVHPIVKVVSDSGCQSYLIGCRDTGKALLVDPKVGRRDVIHDLLQRFELEAVALVDTHTHADHLSDSVGYVREGLTLYMSRHTQCRRPIERVGPGDEIAIGRLRFTVIETPGHTDDSVTLHGHGLAFVGDTLFAGGLARADFRGSNPARLFESVRDRILTLPGGTVVFPGHGYRDVLFTTVGVERARNPALRLASGAAYAADVAAIEGAGNTPDVDVMLALNQEADPRLPDDPRTVAACCAADGGPAMPREREETPAALAPRRTSFTERHAWIDVRDAWEFDAAHIPGTENVPLGELGFHLDELRRTEGPIVFSCLGGVRSMTAARTLRYLDVVRDPISMSGGFREWREADLPVESGEE